MELSWIHHLKQKHAVHGSFTCSWRLKQFSHVDAVPGKSCRSKWFTPVKERPYLDSILTLYPGGENEDQQQQTTCYLMCRNTNRNMFAKMIISFRRCDGQVIAQRSHGWGAYNINRKYKGPEGVYRQDLMQKLANGVLLLTAEVTYTTSVVRNTDTKNKFLMVSPQALLAEMFDNMVAETEPDISIRTGGHDIRVHKTVLIGWSKVFAEALLQSPNALAIEESEFDPEVVQAMVFFLYHASLRNLDLNLARNLILIGHKYDVPGLKNYCYRFLASLPPGSSEDTVDNVEKVLFKLPLYPLAVKELVKCLRDSVY